MPYTIFDNMIVGLIEEKKKSGKFPMSDFVWDLGRFQKPASEMLSLSKLSVSIISSTINFRLRRRHNFKALKDM